MKKIFCVLLLISIVFSISSCTSIPSPKVTKAEFPFEIVYELDGEPITVNDIYVCEFDGLGWNENFGKHRQWKGYVKSTGKSHVVLLEDGDLKLACDLGSPAYYMSDPSAADVDEFTPHIYYIRTFASGGVSSGVANIEPLLEKYKIKLISWNFPKPIENYFE